MFGIYDVDTDELIEGGFFDEEYAKDVAFGYTTRGEQVEVRRQPKEAIIYPVGSNCWK